MSNSENDRVITGRGDDVIDTGEGNDLILSGRGDDTIDAGTGNDLVLSGRGDDVVDGGEGNDLILTGSGDDTVQGGAGNDIVLAGRGDDVLIYVASENTDSIDRYDGGRGYDTLRFDLTDENWQDPQFRDELDDYLQFVADANYGCGYVSNGRFTFDSLGLTVSRIENVEVFVNGVEVDPNDNPVEANDDTAAIVADQATVSGNVLDNDSVLDGVAALTVYQDPAYGTVVLKPDGTYAFTLDPADPTVLALAEGEILTDSFIYEVTDADGDTAMATVNVTITGVDDGVVAVDDVYTISAAGGSISGNVLDNDFAPEVEATSPAVNFLNGSQYSITGFFGGSGNFSYNVQGFGIINPEVAALTEGEELQDVINYSVTDADGDTDTAQLKITIVGVNDRPTAPREIPNISAAENAKTRFDLASFFDDPDSDDDSTTLTYSVAGQPANGAATIDGTELVFDPSDQFEHLTEGQVAFEEVTVTATDRHGATTSSKLGFSILGENDAPKLVAGTLDADEDGAAVTLDLTTLGNDVDSDDDGSSLIYTITGDPSEGSASIDPTTSILTFDPGADFQGLREGETREVGIEVTTTDSHGATDTTTMTVTVTGQDDGVVAVDDVYTISAAGAFISGNVVDNDFAPEVGTSLARVDFLDRFQYPNQSGFSSNGNFSYDLEGNGTIRAEVTALTEGEELLDVVSYTVTDADGDTDTAQLKIAIVGVNDRPTAAGSVPIISAVESVETRFDLASSFDDPDSDDDSTTLTYSVAGQPVNGIASIDGTELVFDPSDQFEHLSDGQNALEQVTVTATDRHGATTNSTLGFSISGENDAPILAAGTLNASEDGPAVTLDLTTLGDDIDNDDDGSSLAYTITGAPSEGSASIDPATGILTFDPGAGFQDLGVGQTRDVEIGVTATDRHGATAENMVTVTVTGENDEPVVSAVIANQIVVEGNLGEVGDPVLNFDMRDYFSDPDDDSLTFEQIHGDPDYQLEDGIFTQGEIDTEAHAFAKKGDFDVTITAQDSAGIEVSQTFHIVRQIRHDFGDDFAVSAGDNRYGSSGDDVLVFGNNTAMDGSGLGISSSQGADRFEFGDNTADNGRISIFLGDREGLAVGDGDADTIVFNGSVLGDVSVNNFEHDIDEIIVQEEVYRALESDGLQQRGDDLVAEADGFSITIAGGWVNGVTIDDFGF